MITTTPGGAAPRFRGLRPAFAGLAWPGLLAVGAVLVGVVFAFSAYRVHVLALPLGVVAVVLAVVSLSRPEIGLAIAFLLLALNAGLIGGKPWLPGTAWTVMLFAAWVAGRHRDGPGPTGLGLAALAFGLLGVLGLAISGDPATAVPILRSLATGLLLLVMISSEVRTREQVQWVVGGMIGGAALIGSYATLEYLRGSGSSVGFITDTGELVTRVTAGFDQPNQLAGFLVLVVALAVGGALVPGQGRAFYAIAAAVCVVGVYASFSRGALLGLVVLPLVFLGSRRALLLAPLVVVAFLVMTPGLAQERFATLAQGGGDVADRVDFWRTARSLWADDPVFGVGPGGFGEAYAEARVPGKRFLPDTTFEPPPTAHNLELNLLAEQGAVGLVGFVVVFGLSLRDSVRLQRSSTQWISVTGKAIGASLLAFAIHNQFDVTLSEVTGTYFWGLVGLLMAVTTIERREQSPAPQPVS